MLNLTVLAVLTGTFLCGCGDQSRQVDSAAETVPVRELAAFPSSSRLQLGEFQAQVRPLISLPVTAPADGDILFHVDRTRQNLAKGTLWAEVSPEQIAGEELEIELNTRTEQLRLREEIQQAEREADRVEFMLADPALQDMPYGDRVPLSTNLVKQLQGEVELLKEQLENVGIVERLTFEQKALRSRLVMPFDGELILALPVSAQRKTIRVASNTPIGTMRDISEIHLHLIIRDPQLVAIPPEQLVVEFKRETGDILTAGFYDTQIIEMSSQDVLIYRFGFAAEEVEKVIPLIGANLTCDLWVESDTAFHAVPKLEVARMLNGKDSFTGWREAATELWSSSRVLYIGRTHLGIRQGEAQ